MVSTGNKRRRSSYSSISTEKYDSHSSAGLHITNLENSDIGNSNFIEDTDECINKRLRFTLQSPEAVPVSAASLPLKLSDMDYRESLYEKMFHDQVTFSWLLLLPLVVVYFFHYELEKI